MIRSVIVSVACVALFSAVTWAQDPGSPPAQPQTAAPDVAPGDVDEVVVTGSRIARDPNLGSVAPVLGVEAEQLGLSGQTDLVDLVNDVPALSGSVAGGALEDPTSEGGIARNIAGRRVLSLRGLGADRTLVLIDGRRHVAGVEGSAAVDVGTIPRAMIERIDVLTGGASSIYGADAVTGVVNFITRDDYDGLEINLQRGITDRGDGDSFDGSFVYGMEFADGRGRLVLGGDGVRQQGLRNRDRRFSKKNRQARNFANPALRFQAGEISAADTPNFAQLYDTANGLYPYGNPIPRTAEEFIADYTDVLGGAPGALTPAEMRLINRAANAPSRALMSQPTFAISSGAGVIAPGDFSHPGLDFDGDGTDDCLQSFVGFNSTGALGGCYTVGRDGSVGPLSDGLIADGLRQFGGGGIETNTGAEWLLPDQNYYNLAMRTDFEFAEAITFFGEAKYSYSEAEFGGPINSFYDLLRVSAENPFIPDALQDLANTPALDGAGNPTGEGIGLYITRDPKDLGRAYEENERDTYRFVGGFKGLFPNGWDYEVSANYGNSKRRYIINNAVLQDRFFAAIDVVTDPVTGAPVCRSELDPTALPPTTPFDIPLFDPAFLTFRPGMGECVPANILNGPNSVSPEAVSWMTTRDVAEEELSQFVLSGFVTGELGGWFQMQGGPLGFAIGAEYRDEKSKAKNSRLARGVLPFGAEVTDDDGNPVSYEPGTTIHDVEELRQQGLLFDPGIHLLNSSGSYDVMELFAEVSLPLARDLPGAYELSLTGAARWADYSTVGSNTTWNVGASWAPVYDIRFRGSIAEAIRAPNISELFSPAAGAFYQPIDPCDADVIQSLFDSGQTAAAQNRVDNCLEAGLPEGFTDPLSARFTGVSGGNPELREETARTRSFGFVTEPRFLEGFSLSADYWEIEIEDPIDLVSDQDILDSCYESSGGLGNQYCALIGRNFEGSDDPTDTENFNPQFGGINFLRQTLLNFTALETSGIDLQARYEFDLQDHSFALSVLGTRVFKLDRFFDPQDTSLVDPELGEIQRPEWLWNFFLDYRRGPVGLQWHAQYVGEQALRGVEIEDEDELFGGAGMADGVFLHNFYVTYDFELGLEADTQLYAGIRNVTGEKPFKTEESFPVSPLGRSFYAGVRGRF